MSRHLVARDAGDALTVPAVAFRREWLGRRLPDGRKSVAKALDLCAEWSG
jgi:hypothetical protein